MRRYTMLMADDEQEMAEQAVGITNDPLMRDDALPLLGITNYEQYTRFIMDPPNRGHRSSYANVWVEGVAAATALGRVIIVESVYYDIRDTQTQRNAIILLPTGQHIVQIHFSL